MASASPFSLESTGQGAIVGILPAFEAVHPNYAFWTWGNNQRTGSGTPPPPMKHVGLELKLSRPPDLHKPLLCHVDLSDVLGLLELVSVRSQCLAVPAKSDHFFYPSAVITSFFIC